MGLAALTRLRLSWCDSCDRLQRDAAIVEAAAWWAAPPPPSLATRLPSLRSFLSRATGVREVLLSDGCGLLTHLEAYEQPLAARQRVWGAVGVALRGTPLVSVSVRGVAAIAALTNPDGPPCDALRSLRLERLADRDANAEQLLLQVAALLRKVASSLACLVFGITDLSLGEMVRSIAAARRLPALHELSLGKETDSWLQHHPLGPVEAATVASVCPSLTALRLCVSFGRGYGRAWAVARERLMNLRTLHICAGSGSPARMSAELADMLAGRRLDELQLTAFKFRLSDDVVSAILGCDRLPATLHMDKSLSLTSFDCLRLCQDYRAAADLVSLSLPQMRHPETFLPGIGCLARMECLQLAFNVRNVNADLLRPGAWAVPPRLRRLSVELYSRTPAAGPGPPSTLPLVAWLVRSIADAPCVATLTEMVLRVWVPPEQPLTDSLSPLAGARMLRTLDLSVCPISDDGVGKQARLQRHMAALLTLAKVRVGAFHRR